MRARVVTIVALVLLALAVTAGTAHARTARGPAPGSLAGADGDAGFRVDATRGDPSMWTAEPMMGYTLIGFVQTFGGALVGLGLFLLFRLKRPLRLDSA